MTKMGGQSIVPPPQLDEDGNPIVDEDISNVEISTSPTVEELMKKLEKVNAELMKLKKDKKGKKKTSHNDDEDIALFMKKFKKYVKKMKFSKGEN
jgi:hypothetical protein